MRYWDAPRLRQRAKAVMQGHYWLMFLVSLGCSAAAGAPGLIAAYRSSGLIRELLKGDWYLPYLIRELLPALSLGAVFTGLGLLWVILAVRPLEVGQCRFFTLCRYGKYDEDSLLFSFRGGFFKDVVGTMLVRDIKVLLWSLLLVVPGIVKAYEWFMVPYIMAENPRIRRERAFEISSAVTRGEKGRMLGLDAVFLLVYLAIGALASLSGFLALAALFVLPYHKAVRAELYGALRYKGAREGLFSPSEIGAELFD